MSFYCDDDGYFGEFGGAFVPEMLQGNIAQLRNSYQDIIESESFQKEYVRLLADYVGRPSPLYYAKRLSEKYKTNLYLKREDLNHTGSHKINNTVGQILLAKELGKTRIIAETGAGQHGVATATVCTMLGFECIVYMGARDVERQSPNVKLMKFLGARVVPVTSGSSTLKDATNEALRDWIANPEDTHYIIGSVVGPHPFPDMVAKFHSIIGKEIRNQLSFQTGKDKPDVIIACIGGGSNAIGTFAEFLGDSSVRLIGVEAGGEGVETDCTAATLSLGTPGVLHGSRTVMLQTGDGQVKEAHSISAGLDYPGVGPHHAYLKTSGRVDYVSVTDTEALAAAEVLARTEGIVPALETAHAFAYLEKEQFDSSQVVVVNLSGSGRKDLGTYLGLDD